MTAIFSVYGPVTLTADINVGQSHPVPGPILGAGIPGLFAGSIVILAFARRRRAVQEFANAARRLAQRLS